MDYKTAGLDLDVYDKTVSGIMPLVRKTHRKNIIDGFGGFAAVARLGMYRDPAIVTCTDGVGSKLKIAAMMNRHDTVGIDLVAMSVNDCLCSGGEPILFLDYIAMPKDDPELTKALVQGISDGCIEANCSLVGGETAILPDFYQPGDCDMAGFCVGVCERHRVINGSKIKPGDTLLGLASNGLHSNGYSLVRKILQDKTIKIDEFVKSFGRTVGDELLRPTRIYARSIVHLLTQRYDTIHGIAHITGGGLVDNIPRILPPGCRAFIRRETWEVPPIFPWLQKKGDVLQSEMERVFNMGIGMVLVLRQGTVKDVQDQLDVKSFIIGSIRSGEPGVEFENLVRH